jgi:mannose-6-phosphate isomerase-like protein (cupin superfamily)
MRTLKISFALAIVAAVAGAQSAPPDKIVATNSEIMAMVAKAKADRKPDQPTFAQPLLALAPYGANLEYRAAIGPSAVHKKYAEFFYVVDGSATLVTGGKLANEKSNGDNLSGTGIEGGSPRQVAKGDFVIVPEGTPHWFSAINGNITLMSFRLPRP